MSEPPAVDRCPAQALAQPMAPSAARGVAAPDRRPDRPEPR